jgi:PD-(D/E)XK nuclease superfamily
LDSNFLRSPDRSPKPKQAVGAVRGELRHSNFLAFLLSPHGSHGLSSEPLQRILRGFIGHCPRQARPIGSLKVAVGDLDGALVFRERDNIDLLVEIKELNLVVAIENKVDAKAGEGQLAGYKAFIKARYPGWRQLLVFLTPEGIDPEEDEWVAYSYIELARIIEALAADGASSLPTEVALVLRHYIEMLRRHIVPDEELKELALQIYQRHREALDFIFECRLDVSDNLLSVIRPLLEERAGLVTDRQTASMLRFAPAAWGAEPSLNACSKDLWTKTGRNVIFEVKSFKSEANKFSDRILLSLILGPSDVTLRQNLFDRVRAEPKTFVGASRRCPRTG